MFHGSIVALVTPMATDNAVDFKSLQCLVEWHINAGTDAILILGTTGESPTILDAEREQIIKRIVDQVDSRIPVIAGTGSNATAHTIELTRRAMECGVDACVLVTPYYNKPTQEGLYRHFKAVADAVPVPQILYNVPSRTGCDLLPETVIRLTTLPNIIGIKEASGEVDRVKTILNGCEDAFDIYAGNDDVGLEILLTGGKGIISVTANVAPALMHELCVAAISGKVDVAKRLNNQLTNLYKALAVETNPIPCKWALTRMGKIHQGIRLPLVSLSEQHQVTVLDALNKCHL